MRHAEIQANLEEAAQERKHGRTIDLDDDYWEDNFWQALIGKDKE